MSDRPLRFCMITTFFPPHNFGGDGIFVQRLSHELARRGKYVEVDFVGDGEEAGKLKTLADQLGISGRVSKLGARGAEVAQSRAA